MGEGRNHLAPGDHSNGETATDAERNEAVRSPKGRRWQRRKREPRVQGGHNRAGTEKVASEPRAEGDVERTPRLPQGRGIRAVLATARAKALGSVGLGSALLGEAEARRMLVEMLGRCTGSPGRETRRGQGAVTSGLGEKGQGRRGGRRLGLGSCHLPVRQTSPAPGGPLSPQPAVLSGNRLADRKNGWPCKKGTEKKVTRKTRGEKGSAKG